MPEPQPPPEPRWRIEELLRPDAFAHPAEPLSLLETHLSWVVLAGEFAYKIKKALAVDFVDASTLGKRARLCAEELRLNRRLAPELYVSVVDIRRGSGGVHIGGDGELLDHAVCMRRFPESHELKAMLEARSIEAPLLAGLGRDLARFHAVAAACLEDPTGYGEQLQRSVQATLCTLREHVPLARAAQIGELGAWLETELRRRQGLLARRAREGHVREGHGDLHARNIVLWNGRLVPFDCLEFDLRLRCIDVLADAGFLVMDLRAQGRLDLAATFLNAYLEQSGDYAGLPLLPCFAVHRALVRAMVDALAIDQHPQRGELRERLEARLGAAATWRQSQRPLLCLMHGLSGSGKSWLSEQLVGPLGALRLRSDLERRRSPPAGTPPSADRSDRYDPAARRAVYQRLANAAAACLAAGLHTLVDATFLQETDRKVFRDLAAREGATLRILSCRAPRERLAERIRARAGSTDPSEATVEVLARQIRAQEPLTQAELALTIDVDTGRDDALAATLDALRSSLTSSKPL